MGSLSAVNSVRKQLLLLEVQEVVEEVVEEVAELISITWSVGYCGTSMLSWSQQETGGGRSSQSSDCWR